MYLDICLIISGAACLSRDLLAGRNDRLDTSPLLLILSENQSESGVSFMLAESFLAITALTALMVIGLAALAKLLFGE